MLLLFKKILYTHDIFTKALYSALQMLIKIFQLEIEANLKGVKLGRKGRDNFSKTISEHLLHLHGSHPRTWFPGLPSKHKTTKQAGLLSSEHELRVVINQCV